MAVTNTERNFSDRNDRLQNGCHLTEPG